METFRYGPLEFSEFDADDEIQILIEGIDYESSIYVDRATAIKLRDWLTEQIECVE